MDWMSILPFAVAVMAAASTGAIFQPGDWYRALNKPNWTPPDWAFPVVWTTLYIMIAAAGWLVFKAEGVGLALIAWALNIAFNAAWSWLMFGRKQIGLALADAIAMMATIVAFMALAWPVAPTAVWLFVPYAIWVAIAIALNFEVLRRNPNAARA